MLAPSYRETRSTCPYCGVGCGVVIASEGTRIVDVRGDPDHPANFGRLCTKGSTLALTADEAVAQGARVREPQLRGARGAAREAVAWDAAIAHAADKFAAAIKEHGPDAVAFYVSGQILTEDYYVFNKIARALVGTNNIDSNSRLCMSSAVAGYRRTLGVDGPPTAYEDIDHADVIFITGSNAAWAHPVLYRRLEDARARRPDLKVIVADPRLTETARAADLHLALLPGSDVALHHGLLHLALWDGHIDRAYIDAHTEGFDALRDAVRDFTPARTAQLTGLAVDDLVQAARWIGSAKGFLSLYCQGLNQSTSGTAKNESLINLHLALGQIGKPGAGPFSLTGQPNAMGGRETGSMANLLPGHRDPGNAAHRAELAALWGVPALPEAPGLTAVEMFEAAADGRIKALWIACTNPAQSLPDQALVARALDKVDFVVVAEAFRDTATADFADLLLPAATWGEKEGTVTNSERRISRVRAARPAYARARPDWEIGVEFARALEARLRPGTPTLFAFSDAQSVWLEHRETTRGRDLDIGGLSWDILERDGPQQWPFPAGAAQGRVRLYGDGVFPTASGKAKFAAVAYRSVAEAVDARYPLALNTGRLRDHWHGMSRSARAPRLFGHVAEPALSLNPRDAARRGFKTGDLIRLTTRRGSMVLPWMADDTLRSGQAYVPMHWGSEFVSGGINTLTQSAIDPVSKQPELKHSALAVAHADLPWRAVLFAWFEAGEAQRARREAMRWARPLSHASCVPFGRDRHGLVLRLAHATAPTDEAIAPMLALFGLADARVLVYADPVRGQSRRVRLEQGKLVGAALLGDVTGEDWLLEWHKADATLAVPSLALLRPSPRPPVAMPRAGRTVCNCYGIDERALAAAAASAPSGIDLVEHWKGSLKCGTSCGSCVPELHTLAARARTTEAVAP
ncbi:MAG: molybdopterin-dependent oxidoreductase [Burkholderiales bacterium]|nr:molybdopterin-dependent oxidoreductase [Burkholderiales bacterium]